MQSEPVRLCLQCMLLINTSIPVRRGVRKCKAGQPLFSADCPLRLRCAVGTQRLGFLVVWQCLHTHGWSEDRTAWGRRVASYVHSGWKREETWIQVLRSALKCFWQVSINFVLPIGFTVSAISMTLTYSLVTSCLAKSRDTFQSSFCPPLLCSLRLWLILLMPEKPSSLPLAGQFRQKPSLPDVRVWTAI